MTAHIMAPQTRLVELIVHCILDRAARLLVAPNPQYDVLRTGRPYWMCGCAMWAAWALRGGQSASAYQGRVVIYTSAAAGGGGAAPPGCARVRGTRLERGGARGVLRGGLRRGAGGPEDATGMRGERASGMAVCTVRGVEL